MAAIERATPVTDRDRVTLRRALRAALVVAALTAAILALLGGPAAGVVAAALALGSFAGAGWLLLSVLLDTFAGEPPDRRRMVWTVVATVVALFGPFLLVTALATGGDA